MTLGKRKHRQAITHRGRYVKADRRGLNKCVSHGIGIRYAPFRSAFWRPALPGSLRRIAKGQGPQDSVYGQPTVGRQIASGADPLLEWALGGGQGGGDMLDLRNLLAGAQLTGQEVSPNLASYFTVVDQGADAVLLFDPLGHGGGSGCSTAGPREHGHHQRDHSASGKCNPDHLNGPAIGRRGGWPNSDRSISGVSA